MVNNHMVTYNKKEFTEHDFVATLLSLLSSKGVYQLTEESLAKKLYYYYIKDEYRELFRNIALSNGGTGKEVNINCGLYLEKYFSNNIFWDAMNSHLLNLYYNYTTDTSHSDRHLTEDGKVKIRIMAEELAKLYKAERKSRIKVEIYGVDPNQTYTLIHGKNQGSIIGFELLTDGEIASIETPVLQTDDKVLYESPLKIGDFLTYDEKRLAYVTLRNATFAIKQGICDGKVRNATINTTDLDEETLAKIVMASNQNYQESQDTAITEEAPFVRKLTLK